ncbi:MAG TPA: hypothetical protein VK636_00955 [Gemmatimonadaceae bacterium]|nr:hypothetical protein [Gemmatimonadaceae bacterium]
MNAANDLHRTSTWLLMLVSLLLAFSVPGLAQQVSTVSDTPDTRRRVHAIEYSDAYNTRLTIHRLGSYTMLPLVGAEYYLGDRLLNGTDPPGWVKNTHVGVASAIGVLFTVNTVTGAWNLWDSRHDPAGRTRRYIHASLMLAADAGFAWAGAIGGDADHGPDGGRRHRNVALGSIALSTAGTALMWFWKD